MSARTQGPVDPYTPSSKAQRSRLANGTAPNIGQSRRQDQADLLLHSDHDNPLNYPPVAPEVPRAPPTSYWQANEEHSMGKPLARSFSQRARGQMIAQEALEDDEYWDEQDNIPAQLRTPNNVRKSTGRSDAKVPLQNGSNTTDRDRKARRGPSQKQEDLPLRDGAESTSNAPRENMHQLRHSADLTPLKLDVSSPSAQNNTVRGPKNLGEVQRRKWADDRSPLQTLEVKLNDISKEEKRARVEEAEMLLRESKAGRGGRQSSKEVPAATKRIVSKREPPLGPIGLEAAEQYRSASSTQQGVGRFTAPMGPQKSDTRALFGEDRQRIDHQEDLLAGVPIADEVIPLPDQPRSRQQLSKGVGQIYADPSTHHAVSLGKPRQEPFQEPLSADHIHPAHDPRLVHATGHLSDGPTVSPEPRRYQLQNEVRRATSNQQALVGQSIPSSITRAVSLQQRQPQSLFSDDRPTARSGPMRESNSSHKAALVEASAAIGGAGAAAATISKRDNSRKLQKTPPGKLSQDSYSEVDRAKPMDAGVTQVSASAGLPRFSPNKYGQDPKVEFYYKGMPKQVDVQRPSSQRALAPVGLGVNEPETTEQNTSMNRPRRTSVSFQVPFDKAQPVNEWKQAGIARLTSADLALEVPTESEQAWWEQNGSSGHRRSKRSSAHVPASEGNGQQELYKSLNFKPPLYLKCGPLLRYTGMRRDREELQPGQLNNGIGRETWRGSVMIVTQDSQSSYEEVPTLRLFSQPRDLLPPPPDQVEGDDLAPEYVDPIAGLTKVSRRGQTLYVKPVDHLEEGKDLSRIENDDGLFETSPSPSDNSSHGSATPNKRTRGRDGESVGKYKEVKGARLYTDIERDVTFWRFNIEVELADQQSHIAYRINHGSPVGFWVPAKGQSMNIMFHSCNGFSLSVNSDQFGGPDPLWRDVLNTHQTRPFHVMIGGGDQLYNDRVMVDTEHFAAWTHLRNPHEKHHAPFTDEMRQELETFYLNRYAMWFSQGLFGLANSQIPMVNIYDDHDIIDGFGSYPDAFQRAPVFMGIGNIAFKYYMLFQHQSMPEETQADEPSWLLGAKPGPYIQQLSRSVFMNLGKSVAFLGLDCRTERERYSVLTDDTYDLVLDRCRREIEEGATKHLLVLLGVPIAYPRMVWLESILTSRAMAPVKALGRAGIFKGGFLNKFDGGVEVLDDLDDHWTASGHKEERNNLIRDLQDLAAEKSIRVTILSGDVHLGAVGQFYSNPKLNIPKDRDHRYIPNVISSAIVNTPPPEMLADTLNKRNKVHHLDSYTAEDMIPMFTHDVDGQKRNNKRLLPRRNWCSIREYQPGSTPPPTPPESLTPSGQMSESEGNPPQTRRRFSFSRQDANPRKLIRRLSQRGGPPSSYRDDMNISRRASHDGYFSNPQQPQTAPPTRTSFPISNNNNPAQPQTAPANQTSFNSAASYDHRASIDALPSAPQPRPGILRRPTNLSEKAAKKGGAPAFAADSQGNLIEDLNDHINLEGGLDITLNCEVNQGDPAGITTPYRLLVPALRYDGSSDIQKLDDPTVSSGAGGGGGIVQRKPTLLKKLGFGRTGNRSIADRQGEGNWGQPSDSGSEMSDEKPYAGEHDGGGFYDGEQRSSGGGGGGGGGGSGGGLKRFFSGRKARKQQQQQQQQQERYSPEYDQPPTTSQQQQQGRSTQSAPTPAAAPQTKMDEFAGRDVRTSPPLIQQGLQRLQQQLQQQQQQQQLPRSPTTRSNRNSYEVPPLQPFPSQARGKAARVMGVDQGPLPPFSSPAGQVMARSSQTQATTNPGMDNRATGVSVSVNQSQPLRPLMTPPTTTTTTTAITTDSTLAHVVSLPSPGGGGGRGGGGGGGEQEGSGSRFYANYGLARASTEPAMPPRAQEQGRRGSVAGMGMGQGKGKGKGKGKGLVRGYSGVEAYHERGRLRKLFT